MVMGPAVICTDFTSALAQLTLVYLNFVQLNRIKMFLNIVLFDLSLLTATVIESVLEILFF